MRFSASRRRGLLYPLYWTAYEQSFVTDSTMPEDRYRANIDWVAEILSPYGYTMVTTDGWLGSSTVTNENGYLLKYADSWSGDWQYWADYIIAKGLVPGVYYNPMWVLEQAADDPTKKIIGTDIPLSFVNNGGWADPTKAGAKEYMQGYVKYFKNMGYKFLRVDFVSWYESGASAGAPPGSSFFGTDGYVKAINWIQEAAGDDMEFSIVMPNNFNHANNEVLYGDMMRIASDTTNGDWTWLNLGSFGDERQTWQPGFNQWANPFQGLTCYCDVSGKGSIALDGDFLRLSGFTRDYEKQTNISLFTMAGSPLAVASQYDTIADNLPFLINKEILSLKQEGFTGKAFFYNGNKFEPDQSGDPDTGSRSSQHWLGQTINGDWVVALFNRSDISQELSLNFAKDLGLIDGGDVYDIWSQSSLGVLDEYRVTLMPHESAMARINPIRDDTSVIRYEAEMATACSGAHFNNDHAGHSGNGFIDNFANDHPDSHVVFGVEASVSGDFKIIVGYANGTNDNSYARLTVNDLNGNIISQRIVTLAPLNTWELWGTAELVLSLIAGTNLITLSRVETSDINAFNLDYIDIKKL